MQKPVPGLTDLPSQTGKVPECLGMIDYYQGIAFFITECNTLYESMVSARKA